MRKNNLLLKYIFSYVSVLFIPLLILGIIIKGYFINTYSQFVRDQKVGQVQKIKASLDMQIQQLHNFALQVSNKSTFSRYNIENNPSAFNEIMKEFRYFIHINTNLQEIIYHLNDSNVYYMSTGTSNDRYLFKDIMKYEEIPGENSNEFFINLKVPTWLKSQTVYNPTVSCENTITYLIPSTLNNSTIMYQLSSSFFDQLFTEKDNNIGASIFLLDPEGNLVYEYNIHKNLLNSLGRLTNIPNDKIEPISIDNEKYYIYKTTLESRFGILVYMVPELFIRMQVNKFSRVYYVGLIMIALLSSITIYWYIKQNYNPIKKLGYAARMGSLKIPENLNVLESIEFAIDNLSKGFVAISEVDKKMMRESRLFCLLRGQYKTIDEFNYDCKNLDLFISGSSFRVVIFLTEFNSGLPIPEPQIINQLCDMLISYEVFVVEYLEQFSYILILSGDGGQDEDLSKRLRFIQMHYKEMTKSNLTIGIGNEYNQVSQIFQSYTEAQYAVEYKLVRGSHSIIFYKDIYEQQMPSRYTYPKIELDSLYYAIINGNIAKIEFIIDMLINLIRKEYHSLFLATCLCYDIINTALRAIHDITLSISFSDKYSYIKFTSIDEFVEVVEMICGDIIECLEKDKKKNSSLEINAVIAYIKENYTDPSFCVSSLADHFNMSISNFSHQFKSQMDQNASAYINNLRIQNAKILITSTELSINEIALKVGYHQPSSFIRMFKQSTGKTPGEYRMENDIELLHEL
ncbi:MAG: helix-turn-helix domain-containing protein [Epulopiscium sp.]|nr:helix-turn-helix domain-containing protein [Candidatus Epulonipiscium sp.]